LGGFRSLASADRLSSLAPALCVGSVIRDKTFSFFFGAEKHGRPFRHSFATTRLAVTGCLIGRADMFAP
jgi:hypothetical protein